MLSLDPAPKRLVDYARGSGCGCKLAAAQLDVLLGGHRPDPIGALLSTNAGNEDAAVYDTGYGQLLLSTVDFFMPVVDDPFLFGQIAAANALSDIYAMGGTPAFALAIMGWPAEQLGLEAGNKVMQGCRQTATEAGITVAGGHTIDSREPFFGLAVNGFCLPQNLRRNNTPKPGDQIFITKAIGTGILATAYKRKLIGNEQFLPAIQSMLHLNREGVFFGQCPEVHALTDITGFGLLGHLLEMCGPGLAVDLYREKVPILSPLVDELSAQMIYADNTMRSWNAIQAQVQNASGRDILLYCDPQTGGGLCVAVDSAAAPAFQEECQKQNISLFHIGQFTESPSALIRIL
jgi:selenide,water dikinase